MTDWLSFRRCGQVVASGCKKKTELFTIEEEPSVLSKKRLLLGPHLLWGFVARGRKELSWLVQGIILHWCVNDYKSVLRSELGANDELQHVRLAWILHDIDAALVPQGGVKFWEHPIFFFAAAASRSNQRTEEAAARATYILLAILENID